MTQWPGREVPADFITAAFAPDDWIAVFLKSYATGRTAQRVQPAARVVQAPFLAWLRAENASGSNVYVSVNTLTPGRRSRTRASVQTVRHLFLDADAKSSAVLGRIKRRPDLPPPSYVVQSSRDRAHILWRARDFRSDHAEFLQKQLARDLGTDTAATSCAQLARLPGFFNYKYQPPQVVSVAFLDAHRSWTPSDFPVVHQPRPTRPVRPPRSSVSTLTRARRYLRALGPAVTGHHGDLHTFRACCRLVRGFALDDDAALGLLAEWNTTCQPPWPERELIEKMRHARRYGREPIGGLLEAGQ